jgi:hypothetical protein
VFIPRRDRFARPDDPIDAIRLEGKLREAGVTLVFMDLTLAPLPRGRRDLGESIAAMIDYDRAGEERRDLAQKIIFAQLTLAKAGFSTGGRPPFGFRRWLVGADGTRVRQLAEGEYIKMAGHHVLWLPGPDEERAVINRILDLLATMPASRVAVLLTAEGVPTPDAGRLRTDKGVKHPTSGVWRQQQVTAIARNLLLRAVVEYGRRSMGDVLRFSPEGPRELEEGDLDADDKARVVSNPETIRVKAAARFDALVEPERHARLLAILDERAGTQRGKPRAQDPARNPLGGRIFDMSCGWPLYRQPGKDSFNYTCGLYQQSHGAKCKHNHVDGVLATRFLLGCVRQRVLAPGLYPEVERRVRAIAERERAPIQGGVDLAGRRAELAAVRAKRERAGQNLALADGADQYRAVAAVFDQLRKQEETLEAEVRRLGHVVGAAQPDLEAEVAAAMNGLTHLADLASGRQDLESIGNLFRRINARIFFGFAEMRWKKRVVNKLAGGVVTFGETPPPVKLSDGPTGRRYVKSPAAPEGAAGPGSFESPGQPGLSSGGEGDSLGNACRGERI